MREYKLTDLRKRLGEALEKANEDREVLCISRHGQPLVYVIPADCTERLIFMLAECLKKDAEVGKV